MAKELSSDEIKKTVTKIRQRYDEFCTKFKKSRTIMDAFEDRYLKALNSKGSLTVFLIAEIEAIEEIFKSETEKQKALAEKIQEVKKAPSIADRIFEENRDKYLKYNRFPLPKDGNEELEYLLGSVRIFLTDYWPVLEMISRENHQSAFKGIFDHYYNELSSKYDFKGEMPITRQFLTICSRIPKDYKQIDFECQNILKETAFLVNDIVKSLNEIIETKAFRLPERKLILDTFKYSDINKKLIENFTGLSYNEGFSKILNYISGIVADFRIKDLKKN